MTTEVCPVCNGEGRVYRMTAGYEAVATAANGGTFGWTGPTHEYRTCHICGGSGLMPQSVCTRPHLDDRDALARALNDAGLVARLTDYAMRAHPDTMARDEPNVAESWADAIIAALEVQG